jgi:hypothetical protein
MNNYTMKITNKQATPIVKHVFPEYTGRKFKIEFTESITLYDTNWSGGTKNEYRFIGSNGKIAIPSIPAPWNNMIEGSKIDIPENMLVVEHSYFCGNDMGIRIYANPCHLPKWLNA